MLCFPLNTLYSGCLVSEDKSDIILIFGLLGEGYSGLFQGFFFSDWKMIDPPVTWGTFILLALGQTSWGKFAVTVSNSCVFSVLSSVSFWYFSYIYLHLLHLTHSSWIFSAAFFPIFFLCYFWEEIFLAISGLLMSTSKAFFFSVAAFDS